MVSDVQANKQHIQMFKLDQASVENEAGTNGVTIFNHTRKEPSTLRKDRELHAERTTV
jgi:hypothetical protein